MANANNENNSTLYFIVGGLVVLALIFGFMVWSPAHMAGTSSAAIEPAAGTTAQTDQTKIEYNNGDSANSVTKTTTTQTNGQ